MIRRNYTHILQAHLDILTSDAGFFLEEGDSEVDNSSVVSLPDGMSITASSLVDTALQDVIDMPPRLQRDVPTRFPRMQNEAFAVDPARYHNADRNKVRRMRMFPIRWEHHPEFDNIGLEK
jgi:hypothetical protein